MKWLGIIALFIPQIIFSAPGEREWRIVIENDYKRSKKIWGTYEQKTEKTKLNKSSIKRSLAANMMLKNGKMVLIKPVNEQGRTSYKVKQFPYKRKKGKRYQVSLTSSKKEFIDLYRSQLIAILKKNKIDPKLVDWNSIELEKMNCKSRKRNFNCKIPLVIKSKTSS